MPLKRQFFCEAIVSETQEDMVTTAIVMVSEIVSFGRVCKHHLEFFDLRSIRLRI